MMREHHHDFMEVPPALEDCTNLVFEEKLATGRDIGSTGAQMLNLQKTTLVKSLLRTTVSLNRANRETLYSLVLTASTVGGDALVFFQIEQQFEIR